MSADPNYQIIRINSDERTSGTPTNFTVQFNNNYLQSMKSYIVKSAHFPNLFPNMDDRINPTTGTASNIFTWFSTANAGNLSITIPEGFYGSTDLSAELSSFMTFAMSALAGPPVVTVSLDSTTKKYNFSVTNDTITILDGSVNAMANRLGILQNDGPATSVDASDIPNMDGESVVFLHSRQLSQSRALLSAGRSVSSFYEIPVKVGYAVTNHHENRQSNSGVSYTGTTNATSLNIKLRSADGTLLKLPDNQRVLINLKAWY